MAKVEIEVQSLDEQEQAQRRENVAEVRKDDPDDGGNETPFAERKP